jgi:hypothetical protein
MDVRLKDLNSKMTIAEDIRTTEGALVIGKGQEVTTSLCQLLSTFSRKRTIAEPIRVLVRKSGKPVSPALA